MPELSFFIGQEIRDERKRMELTQQELAEKTGLSRQAVMSYERGESQQQINSLSRVSKALGIELFLLIMRAEKRRSDHKA